MKTNVVDPNNIYTMIIFRGRFLRRIFLVAFVFFVSFYATTLIFGDFKSPKVAYLTELNSCPACYGITLCPELYSNQILLDQHHWHTFLFNAKNIYYGSTTKSDRKVVLKKLAHDWELKEFDSKLCKYWGLKRNCKPIHLLNVTNVEKKIEDVVFYNITGQELEPRSGLIFCPYSFGIHEFVKPAFVHLETSNNHKADLLNIWTMLKINPEPLILQIISKSKGWKVPAYGGVCGRIEVVAHEGERLGLLHDIAWFRKLKIAKQLLDAAMEFTYKHDRYRFYLMDWSIDNIVVNEKDEVTFIDLEDIIVLDKYISPNKDLPEWYKRYIKKSTEPANEFSIQNICRHHLSDHNIRMACHILGGNDTPFLSPIPKDFEFSKPLEALLDDCLKGSDSFKAVLALQKFISDLLSRDDVVGFGAVR